MKILVLLAAAGLLTACSMTLPVKGRVSGSGELFLGDATGHMDGSGEMTLTSSDGRSCAGSFQYNHSFTSGAGKFTCNDGAVGPFAFTSRGNGGMGFGKLSTGERFKFVFGDQATYSLEPF